MLSLASRGEDSKYSFSVVSDDVRTLSSAIQVIRTGGLTINHG